MIMAADIGNVTDLALLDLSTTFDTVDHTILHMFVSHHIASHALI